MLMTKWETDFEFIYDFQRTPINNIKEILEEYLRQKGVLSEKEEIKKIWISEKTELRYEEEFAGYDGDCPGSICSEYKPYDANIYMIKIKTTRKTIMMTIDDGDYRIEILSVKENKKKQKVQESVQR